MRISYADGAKNVIFDLMSLLQMKETKKGIKRCDKFVRASASYVTRPQEKKDNLPKRVLYAAICHRSKQYNRIHK